MYDQIKVQFSEDLPEHQNYAAAAKYSPMNQVDSFLVVD